MPNDMRQKKVNKKLNRGQKCSIVAPQKHRVGGGDLAPNCIRACNYVSSSGQMKRTMWSVFENPCYSDSNSKISDNIYIYFNSNRISPLYRVSKVIANANEAQIAQWIKKF